MPQVPSKKREVVESEKAEEARRKINRVTGKLLRAKAAKQSPASETSQNESGADAESPAQP